MQELARLDFAKREIEPVRADIRAAFPHTSDQPILEAVLGSAHPLKPLRVGVVFSGGQAPGGHNVIAGVLDVLSPGSQLLGFLGGPRGIVEGKTKEITPESLKPYRNQGGFDFLGSGRDKIESAADLEKALGVVLQLKLDGLVIIGGDDSNTNAAVLAEFFLARGCQTRVVGVPKTIDGDLQNAHVAIPFGFDTATKIYAEMIGNICKDALSARKYTHFIKLMGRSASHIALECALLTHPNLCLIAEEGRSLQGIVEEIASLVEARSKAGKDFGVILIPEGLVEFMPEVRLLLEELVEPEKLSADSKRVWDLFPETVRKQLLLQRDPHGNVNVSAIETEELLIELTRQELKKRGFQGKFSPVAHFFGYEGRSALPTNFDATYCTVLGSTAAFLIGRGYTSYMAYVGQLTISPSSWTLGGVPLASLLHFEKRLGKLKPVIAKKLVDLKGAPYLKYQRDQERWKKADDYQTPGPIQFFGPYEVTLQPPLSLLP